MTPENITLVAALLAAFASLLSLFISLRAQHTSEIRIAYRKHLEPYITDLSNYLHQTVATANVLVHKTEETHKKQYQKWREESIESANRLKELRPKLRYPLWGLDEGIRTITRFPSWVDQNRKNPKINKILHAGDRLRRAIDYSVRHSYLGGRPPTLIEKLLVKIFAQKLRAVYRSFAPENVCQEDSENDI